MEFIKPQIILTSSMCLQRFSIDFIDMLLPYTVFIVSGFVALVVHMVVFFLQIKLDPIMQTHDLLTMLCFSHKDMFKSTGILPVIKWQKWLTFHKHFNFWCISTTAPPSYWELTPRSCLGGRGETRYHTAVSWTVQRLKANVPCWPDTCEHTVKKHKTQTAEIS